jgi:TfoX/Sxy family transcriptional regulator of competence genes
MSSDQGFVDYIVEQIEGAGAVSSRKMFGEYAIYNNGKVVALICDNQLFVKPTEVGRQFIGKVVEAPPYTNAKPYFLVTDKCEDKEWLTELISVTTRELPLPKPKKPKNNQI